MMDLHYDFIGYEPSSGGIKHQLCLNFIHSLQI